MPTLYPSFLELDLKHHKHPAMHALISLLAALALLATSAEAKAKPRDAILLSQVSSPAPCPKPKDQQPLPHQAFFPCAQGRQVIAHD